MSSEIKLYNVRDFIRQNEKGDVDLDRSIEIVHELAMASSVRPNHNILLDMRDTTVMGEVNMSHVFQIALEVVRCGPLLKAKIANVLPDDEERLSFASLLKEAVDVQGVTYEIFTNFEAALTWLSEVKDL